MQHYCTYNKLQQRLTISSNLSHTSCGLFMRDTREKFGLENENDSNVNFSSLWIGSRHVRGHAQQCRGAHLNTHVQDCQQMSNGTYIGNPKLCCFGWTGIVPKCPTCYTLSSLSIPPHCTMGENGRTGIHTKVSHWLHLVHPTPLHHGKDCDRTKVSHLQNFVHPIPSHHIHCTMGIKG